LVVFILPLLKRYSAISIDRFSRFYYLYGKQLQGWHEAFENGQATVDAQCRNSYRPCLPLCSAEIILRIWF